ncbi:hypothetical protein C2845_PM18G10980 [Panicum miliaceum]|uniref:Agmatine coumaroyltransferase-2-like n=1 Tax=Panicum miliaceum TaxID=4540 RepID=A0A3L6PMC8_PANMI|nr:hypothetical protein C2845_PM18G10980 [Panicum miliaceum]
MRITVQSSKAVKPAYGRGCNGDHRSSGAFSFATADFVPLTVLDKVAVDAYISRIYFFRPPAPPNSVVEAGLAKALAEYREWAGRLGVDACGNRGILLNDAGVRLELARRNYSLAISDGVLRRRRRRRRRRRSIRGCPHHIISLTVLDNVNFDQYIFNLYFFRPPAAAPSNAVLEQGLAKALAAHRRWAGRFGVDAEGDRAILINAPARGSWRPRPTSRSAAWCRLSRRLS